MNFLYSLAWIDLTGGPLVITAPDTAGRFYELQFIDVYNETPLLIGACTPEKGFYFRVEGPLFMRRPHQQEYGNYTMPHMDD